MGLDQAEVPGDSRGMCRRCRPRNVGVTGSVSGELPLPCLVCRHRPRAGRAHQCGSDRTDTRDGRARRVYGRPQAGVPTASCRRRRRRQQSDATRTTTTTGVVAAAAAAVTATTATTTFIATVAALEADTGSTRVAIAAAATVATCGLRTTGSSDRDARRATTCATRRRVRPTAATCRGDDLGGVCQPDGGPSSARAVPLRLGAAGVATSSSATTAVRRRVVPATREPLDRSSCATLTDDDRQHIARRHRVGTGCVPATATRGRRAGTTCATTRAERVQRHGRDTRRNRPRMVDAHVVERVVYGRSASDVLDDHATVAARGQRRRRDLTSVPDAARAA